MLFSSDPDLDRGSYMPTLMGQRFDAAGGAVGAPVALDGLASTGRTASHVAATPLADGGLAAAGQSYSPAPESGDIGVSRYDAAGNRIGFAALANSGGAPTAEPDIAALADGGYVVVWQSWFQDGPYRSVHGQRDSASGAPVGVEFQVNVETSRNQSAPQVAGLADGGFVVIFSDEARGRDIVARIYEYGGTPGPEVVIASGGLGTLVYSDVAALPGGGFVAIYQDYYGSGAIFGGIYDAGGTRVGPTFTVTGSAIPLVGGDFSSHVSVAARPDGGFVVVRTDFDGDDAGVFARSFDASGRSTSDAVAVNTLTDGQQGNHTRVTLLPSGDALVRWTDFGGNDGAGLGAFGRVLDAWRVGTAGDDVIVARPGGERIDGAGGNDTVKGSAADNTLLGGAGRDRLLGGEGDDGLVGGTGNDSLRGGDGNDGLVGGVGDDTLSGGNGDDLLEGGSGNNLLEGGRGDDTHYTYGSDTFLFTAGRNAGIDVIYGFEKGADLIAIRGGTIADVTLAADPNGFDHTPVMLSGGTRILVLGAVFGTLDARDFVFLG